MPRKRVGAVVRTTVVLFLSALIPAVTGKVAIAGAGASFPKTLYKKITESYVLVKPEVEVTYQPVGSGTGKAMIIQGDTDFAGSDSLLSSAEKVRHARVRERGTTSRISSGV